MMTPTGLSHYTAAETLASYSFDLDKGGNRQTLTETLLVPVDIPVGAYLETEGQVVMEAEHFGERTAGLAHDWLLQTSQSGYTGTSYLQALPDIDIPLVVPSEAITDSPTTRYPIHFTTPGTYTVWSRSQTPNAAGDSLYVGLNGQVVSITGAEPGQWTWANQQTPSGEPTTLSIELSGLYTLTTSMREDGLRLDRLFLTTDTTYLPAGFGPAETARATEANNSWTSITRTVVYTYDHLYRLTAASYSTGEEFGYGYDGLGNQTTIAETIISNTVVTTYSYNALNQLVTADDGDLVWYYTYDANGNLTRQTPGGTTAAEGEVRYSYDAANRLVTVELYTSGSYTLLSEAEYNGIGERMSLTTYALGTPQTVSYILAEGQVLVADDGSQATLHLYGQAMIAEYGSDWSYPLRDSTSSVRQTVNQTGTVTLARTYKPFGGILEESGPYETSFGFVGAQLDRVSGLLYVNGRYYDPVTGRYLTSDYNQTNPYTPRQGPGLWLLLPFVGIVLMLRKRKGGPWQIVILICVGLSVSLLSCRSESAPNPPPPILPPVQYEDVDLSTTRDIPWRDEKDPLEWASYPNSCGPAALYMFLRAEGKNVIYSDLINQLHNAGEGLGSYDGYCCSNQLYSFGHPVPTPTPHPTNWCNSVCTSADTLAEVARKYYGLDIEAHDFWSQQKVYERLRAGHPVLALVRAYFGTNSNYFGHFVVITGLQDNGETVRVYDSYPDAPADSVIFGNTIFDNEEERRAAGKNVAIDWNQFDASWASNVDPDDPLLDSALRQSRRGHIRWAMAVKGN